MFLYADHTVCPRCRVALAPATPGCARCGARLDDSAAYDVFVALQQVDRLVTRLGERPLAAPAPVPARASASPDAPAAVPAIAPGTVPAPGAAPAPASGDAPPPIGSLAGHTGPGRPVLSGLTVPKILLGLGALCLVVAALVFLVVAWASLGVGGRTGVLVGFTLVAGGLATWSARAGLRAGAESMTTVALGLLALDLTGAQGAGWFGDLGTGGFLVLAGTTVMLAGGAAAVGARRTAEPRLLSAEIAASGAMAVALAGLHDSLPFPDAGWVLASMVIAGLLALAGWRLRLEIVLWTAVCLAGAAWAGLLAIGGIRALSEPSWSGLLDDLQTWPLLVAALVAATPAALGRLPLPVRVSGPAVAVALLTSLLATPALDEGLQVGALALVTVVAVHALAAWLLSGPWHAVTAAPLLVAGGGAGLLAIVAALRAVADSALLDHGLWSDDAGSYVLAWGVDGTWAALMPLTAAATAVASLTLLHIGRLDPRLVVAPAGAVVLAVSSLSPVLYAVPRYVAVGSLVLVAAALLAWALRRTDPVAGVLGVALTLLALGGALADDGLTIAVLSLLTTALAVAETRRTPAWLADVGAWLLPASAAATTWAIASAAHLDGGWRAAPVIAVVAALAVVRPAPAHEAVGLGSALVAIVVSSGFLPVDLRLVAAQLLTVALVATYVGVRRRPEAGLVGLVLLGCAGLAAWEDPVTAAIVLAVATAVTTFHEVRGPEVPGREDRTDTTALVARCATPVALGALLWTLAGLGGASAAWQGVPVVVVLGALAVWRPDPEREVPAALVATCAAAASLAALPDPQGWAAAYLTLGGVACTLSALLHPTRRLVAWAGLALLTAATWLRLEQLGVGTVEAYTLPLAAVLLAVGTFALLQGDRSSLRTQGAGLGLALVPTLLQVLAEPLAVRAAMLGVGCVVLVGVGVGKRWAAPLLAGGGTLAVLVVRQMTTAQTLPQWALIALAGVLLTFLGLTWEQRLANVRTAADYVRGLR
ncbi:SCO7613 C-terminal domain-containing membrane protein [Nocardioides sp.]|uniref:SCO7613 C-terminal domain-containing membrane protein n=1 Tax=Nocardioides sp. TaxID=35761 RepID=UPI002CECF987|nr:hypothetical protein [Nocardioides sp.]HSX66531.1 hypothetical protein [Nocardioides sp.]